MLSEVEKITSLLLQRNFDLEIPADNAEDFSRLKEALIDKIDFLLNHDYEKLLWILYRVDVAENKAIAALADAPEKKPAEILADLIIERQIEKAKTRIQFRNEKKED